MRHVRMLGLCLVAVFAVAAVAAIAASAASPEWGKCVSQAGGKYTDSNCTTKGHGGSFEWVKGSSQPNVKFSGSNKVVGHGGVLTGFTRECEHFEEARYSRAACAAKGSQFREQEAPPIECQEEANTGEQTGKNKVADVHVTFKGCGVIGEVPCNTQGAAAGEIKTNELKGELGYINKTTTPVQVGLLLEPAKKHGSFAEFECPSFGIGIVVGVGSKKEGAYYEPESKGGYDGIISPITPVDTMSPTFEQVYTVNPATHENEPSSFEGKHIDLLEDYFHFPDYPELHTQSWSRAGEEITNVNTPEVEGEIKA